MKSIKEIIPIILLVISNLKEKNILDKVGSHGYLTEVANLGSIVSGTTYARKVKELSLRRNLFNNIKEIEKNTR